MTGHSLLEGTKKSTDPHRMRSWLIPPPPDGSNMLSFVKAALNHNVFFWIGKFASLGGSATDVTSPLHSSPPLGFASGSASLSLPLPEAPWRGRNSARSTIA